MSGAVSDALAFLRRAPRLPSGGFFNASGRAGPRRLAVMVATVVAVLAIVVFVALSGRTVPTVSRDARLKAIDPLPGGLHSTPEQDALSLSVTDEQAAARHAERRLLHARDGAQPASPAAAAAGPTGAVSSARARPTDTEVRRASREAGASRGGTDRGGGLPAACATGDHRHHP